MRRINQLSNEELSLNIDSVKKARDAHGVAIGHAKSRGENIQPILDTITLLGGYLTELESEYKTRMSK